jgi:hypothetical protein
MTQDHTLAHGTHATPQDGRCAMEWVSHLAGEPHSDAPGCVSPVLRAICIALNDGLEDGPRQRLRPYLARTIGTAGDGLDPARSWQALDWLIRSYTPTWLALAGLDGSAQTLRRASPVDGSAALGAVLGELARARRAVRTARGRTYGTAWMSAVSDGRAGRAVSWGCAGAAGWAAARVAIEDPAAERARTLLRSIAGDAAAIAVRRVPQDVVCGPLTPLDAARTALAGTLDALDHSAIGLLEAMLPTEVAVSLATSYLVPLELGSPDPASAGDHAQTAAAV